MLSSSSEESASPSENSWRHPLIVAKKRYSVSQPLTYSFVNNVTTIFRGSPFATLNAREQPSTRDVNPTPTIELPVRREISKSKSPIQYYTEGKCECIWSLLQTHFVSCSGRHQVIGSTVLRPTC